MTRVIKRPGSGVGYSGTVDNYAALPAAATVPEKYYFVLNAQGTSWLPGSLGGTYYPNGTYYSDPFSGTWITGVSPYQATQPDVDAGIITDQFVSPATLENTAKWNTKISHSLATAANDFLIASGVGVFIKKTLAETKAILGITNVDNTSDVNKPVSTAQAAADTAVLVSANAYSDSLVVGLWDDRGNFDASVNAYPSSGGSGVAGAILKGDIWTISVGGTLPTGLVVLAGDTVRALIDTPGNTQANWAVAENNIGYAPENVVNKSLTLSADQASDTKYPSVKSVYDWATGLFATIASLANYQLLSGKDATGGYAGLTLFKINFKNAADTFTSFLTNANTASRTYTFQNRNGTIVDDTDLALKANLTDSRFAVRLKDTTRYTNTGSTTENILNSGFLITSNTFVTNDVLEVYVKTITSTGANNKTFRIYFNTTDNLSGSPILVATYTATTAGGNFTRKLKNLGATLKNYIATATSFPTGETATTSTATENTLSVDLTANVYLIVTAQNAIAGESAIVDFISLQKFV